MCCPPPLTQGRETPSYFAIVGLAKVGTTIVRFYRTEKGPRSRAAVLPNDDILAQQSLLEAQFAQAAGDLPASVGSLRGSRPICGA